MEKTKEIDYKDVPTLRRFLTDRGKIKGRRKTGTCAKHQRRLAAGEVDDLDRFPGDPDIPAGAKRFHHRFLGGKARGPVAFRILKARTVLDLTWCEDAFQETLAASLHDFLDTGYGDQIDAMSTNHDSV